MKKNISDTEFIKGSAVVSFIPHGNNEGDIVVTKNGAERKFTARQYFDLDLANWTFEIDNANTQKERLQLTHSAIFMFRKHWSYSTHELIKALRDEKIQYLQYVIEYLNNGYEDSLPKQSLKTKPQTNLDIKPIFKPQAVQQIFNLLKNFFSKQEQPQLKDILKTGNSANKSLIFLDNGNRLADAFKQLKEQDFITGCDKQQLQTWITTNFKFRHREREKSFTPDYIEKCISRKYYPCKKPLFSIRNGEIVINS